MFSAAKTSKVSGGYQVGNSLRFRSSASAYLNRTPASASNRRTWTWSGWVKRGVLGSAEWIFDAFQDANNFTAFYFNSDNTFGIQYVLSGTSKVLKYTTQVFRDPSAWYHIVVAIDTTPATPTFTVYVNGVQVTSFGTNTNTVSQNEQLFVNSTNAHNIARYGGNANYFDGYLAEVNFIDGSALTPSSFGAYDTNGVWQPAKYSGSYGTNGFYLPFSNGTSTTTLGYDQSGNGNNWTTNNISLTSGTTYDWMLDVPTNNSATAANFCVLNPIDKSGSLTLTNGNLQSSVATTWQNIRATFGITSGKWYWEYTMTASGLVMLGIGTSTVPLSGGAYTNAGFYGYYSYDGSKWNNNTNTSYGSSFTTGDVIGVAFDATNGKIFFSKNGTYQASGVPASGTNPAYSGLTATPYFPMVSQDNSQGSNGGAINFGQQPFVYTPPTGFVALNTYNLPTPTITNGAQYMAATLYTGTGSSQTIANSQSNGGNNPLGKTFYPDLTWIKSRSASTDHKLTDSVRGTTKALISDSTAAESTDSNGLTAFTSSGFTIGSDSNYNNTSATYVGWQWLAGAGSSSSNTNGSITSTVSVNATAGFSVVTYTGTGSLATVGHGLGVAPNMIIWKNRSSVQNWVTYHSSLGPNGNVYLNLTAGYSADSTTQNNTAPTSSVFTVATSGAVNGSTNNIVAYCFAAVAGYSAFGSYTGNGSTDGPFIYTGFRPRFVLIKNSSSTSNWFICDTSRDTYNVAQNRLFPSISNAEATSPVEYDILSNGFKIRIDSDAGTNTNGNTYIYAAFAENPFNYSRAR